jgi:large repetitive protein
VNATKAGDTNYNARTSAAAGVTLVKASTDTQITDVPEGSTVCGEEYTVSASVAAVPPGAGTPTGTITISDDYSNSCLITLADGSGSCDLSGSEIGTKTLVANYSGDANYYLSSSDSESHTVTIAATTTTVTGDDPNPSTPGEAATFTAEVEPVAPSIGIPSGTVDFKEGSTLICSSTLTNGIGSCTSDALSIGSHVLTATYNGEVNSYIGSVSGAVTHKVELIDLSDNKVSTSFTDVGNLSTSGGSAPYTYALAASGRLCDATNGAGNSLFEISGSTLQRTSESTAGTYSICIQSTDNASVKPPIFVPLISRHFQG